MTNQQILSLAEEGISTGKFGMFVLAYRNCQPAQQSRVKARLRYLSGAAMRSEKAQTGFANALRMISQ